MNGDVITCKIVPITYEEFKRYPVSVRKYYIETIRSKFHVPTKRIADMMGINKATLYQFMKASGIPSISDEYRGMAGPQMTKAFAPYLYAWNEFLALRPIEESNDATEDTDKPEVTLAENICGKDDTVPPMDSIPAISNAAPDICALVQFLKESRIPFTITISVNP